MKRIVNECDTLSFKESRNGVSRKSNLAAAINKDTASIYNFITLTMGNNLVCGDFTNRRDDIKDVIKNLSFHLLLNE